jgi:hypothetical protein
MTLNEQIQDVIDNVIYNDNYSTKKQVDLITEECEKIADTNAIDFAIWIYEQNLELIDRNSMKQLLRLYKKEQRLY